MRHSNSVVRSEEVAALRRRFLIDMSWPEVSDVLCRMLDLLGTSEDVGEAERLDSLTRMNRLTKNPEVCALIISAAQDALVFYKLIDDEEARLAWFATFALAVVNMLEDLDVVKVA
jgi:hypothetical protein